MPSTESAKSPISHNRPFRPAKHSAWLIRTVQSILKVYLHQSNQVHISNHALETLKSIPQGQGRILTPNHSDETDPLLIFELFRQFSKDFSLMCNREAFDEYLGLSGYVLQRLGYFSVERGDSDAPAKRFSIDTVQDGSKTLVIFPEGEIFYLNDIVQPLHTGTVEIGMQAVINKRKTDPDWTAYIIPTAFKYRYSQSMHKILEARVDKMEKRLANVMKGYALKQRLMAIQSELLKQQEDAHHVDAESKRFADLGERIAYVRREMLAKVEKKYKTSYREQASTIDITFQISAHLRKQMAETKGPEHITEYTEDLATLKEVEQLVSWHPQYVEEKDSVERCAEMITKLERELYHIKRPHQLGKRDVFINIGTPIDLGQFLPQYINDPHAVRHKVTDLLRSEIQSLIDTIGT